MTIGGETTEQWLTLFWGAPKSLQMVTCSHEIKRHLFLGRKAMTNLDRILKSGDSTLPTNVHVVKAMVFPVVLYGCESWTIKKAEHWRIDGFELRCWIRRLRVLWTARRSKKFILKEISPECSLEGLMLKLKLQYFGHLMWRTDTNFLQSHPENRSTTLIPAPNKGVIRKEDCKPMSLMKTGPSFSTNY